MFKNGGSNDDKHEQTFFVLRFKFRTSKQKHNEEKAFRHFFDQLKAQVILDRCNDPGRISL